VRLSCPHPFRKRRGGCGNILACEGAGAILTEPTSLNRGEGLMTGSPGDVGADEGTSGGGGGVEGRWRRGGGGRRRVKLNRDGVDLELKLRLPS